MTVLDMRDVRKVYRSGDADIVALDHATLTVDRGEIVALLGPSGSGKTTLLSIAGGLLTPSEGVVQVNGHDITGHSAKELTDFRRHNVGFVFQSVNLVPFLTAEENLLVVDELGGGKGGRAARDRARQLLDELGLGHRRTNLPSQLSGGERQRVAIARAIVAKPAIVFADEPTGNLDVKNVDRILDLLGSLLEEGITVVLVTHDLSVAAKARRVISMRSGKVQEDRRQ